MQLQYLRLTEMLLAITLQIDWITICMLLIQVHFNWHILLCPLFFQNLFYFNFAIAFIFLLWHFPSEPSRDEGILTLMKRMNDLDRSCVYNELQIVMKVTRVTIYLNSWLWLSCLMDPSFRRPWIRLSIGRTFSIFSPGIVSHKILSCRALSHGEAVAQIAQV